MAIENLSKQQLRGVDLCIKALSKRFPFVEGWRLTDDYQKYSSNLYIDLIVDYKKIGEYYGVDLQPYYKEKLLSNPEILKSSFFGTFFEGGFKYDSAEYHDYIHRWWLKAQDIKEFLDSMYKSLPQDFQVLWSSQLYPEYKHPITLNIEEFVQKKINE